ncbi:MAG: amino acid ABC transporter permease [Erysipelotrichaceae bacterium]|nr:amino acid ABC transporter permease [Erysipelotrichaceae bacterium]MBQ9840484.1 amino acid ABC transporter permease [Erysipelotrichaceae bacterium]
MESILKIFTLENILFLFEGVKISLLIAICSLLLGTIIGTLLASFRISKNVVLRIIGRVYVDLIRGTPMLLQLSFLYLGFPMVYQLITGEYLGMDALSVGIIGIGMNSGAYVCELIRGAINSIDKGQWEAGKSLGLTQNQILMKIILPQSFKRIIPPLANEFIVLIKDSSLVSTIGVYDLMQSSKILGGKYYNYFLPMIAVAMVYLVLTLVISHFTMKLEKRLAESD